MLIQRRYNEIREQIQQGDIIAFGGKGHVSNLIKLFTLSSVSHIAVVLKDKYPHANADGTITDTRVNNIIESTTLNGFSGVVVNRLSKRLRDYSGEVWWLPLSNETREKINFDIFYSWLMKQKGKLYDDWQAIGSAFDLIPDNREDFNLFFCSELAAAAFKQSGGIAGVNCSEITPAELCRWNIYKEDYHQLSGERKEIKRFNSVKI